MRLFILFLLLIGLGCEESEKSEAVAPEIFVHYAVSCTYPCNVSWLEGGKLIDQPAGYGFALNTFFKVKEGDSVYIKIVTDASVPDDVPQQLINGVLVGPPQFHYTAKSANIAISVGDKSADILHRETEDREMVLKGIVSLEDL